MSNEVSSATASPVASSKVSSITKFLTPLIVGTATALAAPSAQATEPSPPTPKVYQIKPQEARSFSPTFAFHNTPSGKFFFGYATGALAGHLLEKLAQRNKHRELEE